MEITQKYCHRCERNKSTDEFFDHLDSPDGKKSICKACCRDTSRAWEAKNRSHISNWQREWRLKNRKRLRAKGREQQKSRREQKPWEMSYYMARARCTNKGWAGYQRYGARGIKFRLTMGEIIIMWVRDQAELMLRPSIDRIDPDKNYVWSNCRFIELAINSRRAMKRYWKNVKQKEKQHDMR